MQIYIIRLKQGIDSEILEGPTKKDGGPENLVRSP